MATTITGIDIKVMADAIVTDSKRMNLPLNAFSTKVEVNPNVMLGDSVQVPYLYKAADATAFNSSTNNYTTDNGGTAGTKSVALNKHYKTSFQVTGAQYNRLGDMWVQETLRSHMDALDSAAMVDIMSLVTNANFGAAGVTGIASTFDATDMNRLRKLLRAKVGPTAPLFAVLAQDYYENLLEDASLKNALNYGGTEVARAGVLANVRGISETYESSLVPGNSENLVGFATSKAGLLFALAIPQKAPGLENAVEYEIAVSPSGMTYGIYKQIDLSTHALNIGVEAIWGSAVGNSEALTRIVSA